MPSIPAGHAKYYIPLLLVLGTLALKGFGEDTGTLPYDLFILAVLIAYCA
ncbi:hypothetical protein J7E78_27720 [Paenibacillus polymyxa]|nr:hypothetical protein [Paenibacillus polymyxa]MBT2287298.1 hypothetical protein [Paenibacillus polymyxa]